jgi:hypothetical protein
VIVPRDSIELATTASVSTAQTGKHCPGRMGRIVLPGGGSLVGIV